MLGMALLQLGRPEEAVPALQRAVALKPDYSEGRYNLGNALTAIGQASAAVDEYRESIRLRSDWPPSLGALAWLEATADITALRNPADALLLATRAANLTRNQDPQLLDVLAAAYAAAGQFPQAVRTAEDAKKLVPPSMPGLTEQIDAHIGWFRAGRALTIATH